jgi:hypothetical protein
MKRILSEPSWGVMLIEDTETQEISIQCMCGGIGMYAQRVILTPDEVEEVRDGTFDADRMASEVCKQSARLAGRLVQALNSDEISQ